MFLSPLTKPLPTCPYPAFLQNAMPFSSLSSNPNMRVSRPALSYAELERELLNSSASSSAADVDVFNGKSSISHSNFPAFVILTISSDLVNPIQSNTQSNYYNYYNNATSLPQANRQTVIPQITLRVPTPDNTPRYNTSTNSYFQTGGSVDSSTSLHSMWVS